MPANTPSCGKAVSPTSEEVVQRTLDLAKAHPKLLKRRKIGASGEGRPLYAVTATDPSGKAQDKQHVLVLGGRHGNEESGRIIALGLLEWLCTPAARETMRKQAITVVPNCNPDACERDIYKTPAGINVCNDLDGKKPIPESVAIETLAARIAPDCIVDLHARGGAGCSTDMALYPTPRRYTEDDNLLHEAAAAMCAAGEKAGTPHVTHPLFWWHSDDKGACARYYRLYKAFPILTETAEHNDSTLGAAHRKKVGLARLKALLAWGNRRHPKLLHEGYPCMLVLGSWALGITARGKTAAARRKSRVDVWREADRFPGLGMEIPEADREKTIKLKYEGKPLKHGLAVQCQLRGRRRVKEARVNGKKIRRSETSGYVTWSAGGHTFVQVALPTLKKGTHRIEIRT